MKITFKEYEILKEILLIHLGYIPPSNRLERYVEDWIDESEFILNKEYKKHSNGAYFYGFVNKIGDVTNYLQKDLEK